MFGKITNHIPWIYVIVCIVIFIFALGVPVDLDLGWHLRYGQYFWQTGHVLYQNIISFIWPGYQWVEASWGYDVILFPLFQALGFWGISLAGALVTVLTFILITWSRRKDAPFFLLALATIFFMHTQPMFIAGFRAQTLSAVFFAIAIVLADSKGYRWLPLVFLVWANTHGGFILGLLLLWGMWIMEGTWRKKGFVLLVSTLAPLLNPYGVKLYEESLIHATNSNLASIGEWTPLFTAPIETAIAVLVFLGAAYLAFRAKQTKALPEIISLAALTWLALSAIRFIIPFGIFTTFLLAKYFNEKTVPVKRPFLQLLLVGGLLSLVIFDAVGPKKYFVLPQKALFSFTWDAYCQTLGTCSEAIAKALVNMKPQGNGFHTYNWGGYLAWRVPQTKTFIDGRMAVWEQHGTTPPIADAERAIQEKDPITWRRLDSSYHFGWAIVPRRAPIASYLGTLSENGQWKLVASDEQFALFVKP